MPLPEAFDVILRAIKLAGPTPAPGPPLGVGPAAPPQPHPKPPNADLEHTADFVAAWAAAAAAVSAYARYVNEAKAAARLAAIANIGVGVRPTPRFFTFTPAGAALWLLAPPPIGTGLAQSGGTAINDRVNAADRTIQLDLQLSVQNDLVRGVGALSLEQLTAIIESRGAQAPTRGFFFDHTAQDLLTASLNEFFRRTELFADQLAGVGRLADVLGTGIESILSPRYDVPPHKPASQFTQPGPHGVGARIDLTGADP